MRGAGGTSGGIGTFFIGLIMMCGGFYLLFNAIKVSAHFSMSMSLYHVPGINMSLTSGMVMIPFIFGIGMVFYNSRNWLGWLLTLGSLTALLFGVISTVRFSMASMTAFELITMLVLGVGGLGLFLRSLKNIDDETDDKTSLNQKN